MPTASRQHRLARDRDHLATQLATGNHATLELQPVQIDRALACIFGREQLAAPMLREKRAQLLEVRGFPCKRGAVVDDVDHDTVFSLIEYWHRRSNRRAREIARARRPACYVATSTCSNVARDLASTMPKLAETRQ